MAKYTFTADMAEIAGGPFETACRKMVVAGLEWLDAHPGTNPVIKEYEGVTGLVSPANPEGESLSKAVGNAVPGCSGVMHHIALIHVFRIRGIGWEQYCTESRLRKLESSAPKEPADA